ncbi:J domain-containing protein [Aspergillus mulundensis]|uniref:J domain-containing protein n=1 Tax=Aspergillus mulundensis TaxID=1810919 RepID=A0A3D8QR89_9EURO|nr:hypothetical protein DSM5745_09747 [Aspergillus mulundensis]RDW64336.1 hypothetical protein DSM5745_09747 [Aspergillus mulundensis]
MAQNQVIVDYYAVLGIPPTADASCIKAAFRTAALAKHPDKNPSPDATSEFQRVGEAYETLMDETRRAHYDAAIYPFIKQTNAASSSAHTDPAPGAWEQEFQWTDPFFEPPEQEQEQEQGFFTDLFTDLSPDPVLSQEQEQEQAQKQEAEFSRIETEVLELRKSFLKHDNREKQRQTALVSRLQREKPYLAALKAEIERLAAQRAACLSRSHFHSDPANAQQTWSECFANGGYGNDEMKYHVNAKRAEVEGLERSIAKRTLSRKRRLSTFQVKIEELNQQWVANGGVSGFKRAGDQ